MEHIKSIGHDLLDSYEQFEDVFKIVEDMVDLKEHHCPNIAYRT